MNTKGLLMALALLMGMSTGVSAQGFLGRLKDRAVQTAKSTIESRVERKVYQETTGAVDDAFDGKLPGKGNKSKNAEEVEAVDEENPDAATSSDFKRGSVILFQDDVTAETVGEFPSKWDLLDGAAEVKTLVM